MRYFVELSYKGTRYRGWQRQPNGLGVQQVLEEAFSTLLQAPVELTGCGRTDTGVHASQFFAHFDWDKKISDEIAGRLNRMIPPDIAVHRFTEVADDAHARFDATRRSYEYHVSFRKNPFLTETALWFPQRAKLDFDKMREAAALISRFEEFATFCKSDNDALTMKCQIFHSEWLFDEANHRATYHISANRFLRGMVRLIVGMCLNVGSGKLSLDVVKDALERQVLLARAESVAPQGLFLTEVEYPFL